MTPEVIAIPSLLSHFDDHTLVCAFASDIRRALVPLACSAVHPACRPARKLNSAFKKGMHDAILHWQARRPVFMSRK